MTDGNEAIRFANIQCEFSQEKERWDEPTAPFPVLAQPSGYLDHQEWEIEK